ncbi:MAG: acyl-CoA reductase [Bacteroidota bacterium]|nr:acyl-CoA reductase [Bacteroidota bacterium]
MLNLEGFLADTQKLKHRIENKDVDLIKAIQRACQENLWFTEREINRMLHAICSNYLDHDLLSQWLINVRPTFSQTTKTIAIISAGNIPLVSFHDILAVLGKGFVAQIKLSEKDKSLYFWLKSALESIHPKYKEQIVFTDKIKNYDAVIATGNNLSANQFKHYFAHVPNLIRGHKNGIAVLHGNETVAHFNGLGTDIFSYYGLGCRNVSKIYVPENYSFTPLLKCFDENFGYVCQHAKYKNNYDYQLASCLMSPFTFLQSETILLVQRNEIHSPLATLNFEYYTELDNLISDLHNIREKVQSVTSMHYLATLKCIALGQTQYPGLNDYADNIDTLEFLNQLS